MKLGSLFDGSGGFPLAGILNGIEPVWASEIEPFPIRVTKQRFPNMKHLGSVTDINGAEIEPVDIITFGSPCQDLSVAGKQKGIHDGERSNLFFEAIRIIKEMREHDRAAGRADVDLRPRYAVWENVPGAFSSNKGADFRAVLQALAEIEGGDGVSVPMPPKGKWTHAGCVVGTGWSIAWRVYDAQYWGVPQRRKRIYLVADFAGERAGEILFESEGVSGDPEQSTEEGEGTAEDAEGCAGGALAVYPIDQHQQDGRFKLLAEDDAVPTLSAKMGTGGNNTPMCLCIGNGQMCNITMKPISNTLDTMHDQQDVIYPGQQITSTTNRSNPRPGDPSPTLTTECGAHYVTKKDDERMYIVRRLTPTECARLQGFPDWWCDGAEGSDSAQYKMWGNGIALPCAADVLRRIAKANK